MISLRPVAWIGQISYGLYLWHWPVILAIPGAWGPLDNLPGSIGLSGERLALTFAAATCSFYLLEQPIRRGVVPVIRASIRRFAVATLAAIVLVGGTAYWQTNAAAPEITGIQAIPLACSFNTCIRYQGSAGAPVVAVIGDSIAQSLDPAFLALAEEHGWTYVMSAAGGCRVTHLLTSANGQVRPADQTCHDKTPGVQRELLAEWHPSLIVDIDISEFQDVMGPDGRILPSASDENVALLDQGLVDVSRQLTSGGARLVFVQIPPRFRVLCGKPSNETSPVCTSIWTRTGTPPRIPSTRPTFPTTGCCAAFPREYPACRRFR